MFIIKYERKTQPMKKILSLSPILLTLTWIIVLSACVSSTTNEKSDESHTNSKIYQNVEYNYDFDKHFYKVNVEDKTFYVPPSNYYEIVVYKWELTDEQLKINNEYFVSTNELFVYERKQ